MIVAGLAASTGKEKESIHANPLENTPRLVYADWLDEHDEPEQAELIRLQCGMIFNGQSFEERKKRRDEIMVMLKDRWPERIATGIDFFGSYYRGMPIAHCSISYAYVGIDILGTRLTELVSSFDYISLYFTIELTINLQPFESNASCNWFDCKTLFDLPRPSRTCKISLSFQRNTNGMSLTLEESVLAMLTFANSKWSDPTGIKDLAIFTEDQQLQTLARQLFDERWLMLIDRMRQG